MIVGVGVDVVDVARFERAMTRTPRLRARLFAESERADDRELSMRSLAARFAAKEALIKAIGHSTGMSWHDLRIAVDPHGNPGFDLRGAADATIAARGIAHLHLSMSHDAGLAVAFVVAESGTGAESGILTGSGT